MTGGLRLMTYNVKGLKVDRDAVATVVREAQPDVLGVQEPPRGPLGWCRTWKFAHDVGMRAVVNGRGARTTALLVAPGRRVTGAHAVRLPWRPGTTRRGASMARVDGVAVLCVHLSLVRDERGQHLEMLLRHLAAAPPPHVLLGDLNERPGGATWDRILQDLTDADPDGPPTYPAVEARHRIDAVMFGPGLRALSATVRDDETVERASDHRPLVVEIEAARP